MGLVVEGIDETIEYVKEVCESALVGSAVEIGSRLAEETPVDTGFARNSWIVTDDHDGIGEPGNNRIDASRLNHIRIGSTVYINNGCNYIEPLDNGHSQKAPAGMTAKVMPEVVEIIQRQVEDAERSSV